MKKLTKHTSFESLKSMRFNKMPVNKTASANALSQADELKAFTEAIQKKISRKDKTQS